MEGLVNDWTKRDDARDSKGGGMTLGPPRAADTLGPLGALGTLETLGVPPPKVVKALKTF